MKNSVACTNPWDVLNLFASVGRIWWLYALLVTLCLEHNLVKRSQSEELYRLHQPMSRHQYICIGLKKCVTLCREFNSVKRCRSAEFNFLHQPMRRHQYNSIIWENLVTWCLEHNLGQILLSWGIEQIAATYETSPIYLHRIEKVGDFMSWA